MVEEVSWFRVCVKVPQVLAAGVVEGLVLGWFSELRSAWVAEKDADEDVDIIWLCMGIHVSCVDAPGRQMTPKSHQEKVMGHLCCFCFCCLVSMFAVLAGCCFGC